MKQDLTSRSLEEELKRLGTGLSYPRTPPLANKVQTALSTSYSSRPTGRFEWRKLAYLGLAAAVLAVIFGLAFPEMRDAVADRLGLRGIRVIVVPDPESGVRTSDPRRLLGIPASVDTAASRVGFQILLPDPEDFRAPDEVFVIPGQNGEVSLLYHPREGFPEIGPNIGLLITQTPGRAVGEYYEKGVHPSTTMQLLFVEGQRALWISGPPHRVSYIGPSGAGHVAEARLARNVLAIERNGLIVRIEGAMDRQAAVRIATSLR